jgi:hypothetical protein
MLLGLSAVGSITVYSLAYALPVWLPDHYDAQRTGVSIVLGLSNESFAHFVLAFLAVFALYLLAFRASFGLRSRLSALGVLGLAAILHLALVPMHLDSQDSYAYIAWADIVLRYGANPFLLPPAAFPDHPLLPFLAFPEETHQYGPLWLVFSVGLRFLSGGDLLVSLLLFKLAASALLIGTAWLVYLTLERVRPSAAIPAALLVAWNPLFVFEFAANAHNDPAMALFLVAAMYFHTTGSRKLAVAAVLGAILVKYVAVVLLPLFLLAYLRTSGDPRVWLPGAARFAAGTTAVGALVVGAVTVEGTMGVVLDRFDLFHMAPVAVARLWLSQSMEPDQAMQVAARIGTVLFALYYLFEMWRLWRRPDDLLASSIRVLYALLFFVIAWFQPWYAVWIIPLAAIHFSRPALWTSHGFTVGAFLLHGVVNFAWLMDWSQGSLIGIHAAGTTVVWLPVGAALLLAWLWPSRVAVAKSGLVGRGESSRAPAHAGANRRAATGWRPGTGKTILLLAGALSGLVYLLALAAPKWLPTYFDQPRMDTPRILGVTEEALAHFVLTFALLFLLYVVAFRASFGLTSGRAAAAVLAGGALLSLPLLLMHPGGAGDIYAYIACADVVLLYGGNPFVTPPGAFPDYPLLGFVDVPNETIQYGPLWLVMTLALRAPFASDLLLTMLAFKVAAAASLLGTAWLAYLILRRTNPGMAIPGALLVAWNPLLIYEMAGNAHNDATMMALVVLAVYFHVRAWHRLSIAALLGAVLVKYVAAIFLPLFLVAMLREAGPARRWLPKAAMFSLGASAAGLAVVAAATLEGTVGAITDRAEMFTTSPTAVANLWLSQNLEAIDSARLVLRTAQGLFGLIFLIQLWRVWRSPAELVPSSLHAVLAFMLLVMSWYQPWYVTWAIPLAALVATRMATAVVVGLAVGAVLIHAVMGFGWRLEWHEGSMLAIQAAGALSAWLPVAIAVAINWAWPEARSGEGDALVAPASVPVSDEELMRQRRSRPAHGTRRAA